MTINVDEDGSYYRDLLIHTPYTFRPEDPKEYGFICPHCFKRYGEKKQYIEVVRCETCPAYYPGMEVQWCITRSKREALKEMGYFNQKPRGGRQKKEIKNETV